MKKLINYAEISRFEDESGNQVNDIDSEPDADVNNDAGGELGTDTDDKTDGRGVIDEDDHDPASTRSVWLDLALKKYTETERVKIGEVVTFDILVVNQGQIAAGKIHVTDYVPIGLNYVNNYGWEPTASPSNYVKVLSVENGTLPPSGLEPGDSVIIQIDLEVDENAIAGSIVNYAEISYVEVLSGEDYSDNDIDSKADDDNSNDAGGVPGVTDNFIFNELNDEDDHDPALVHLSTIELLDSCICLRNATDDSNGQFRDQILVVAPSGETWFISEVNGLYHVGSPPPPAAPTPFITGIGGDLMTELPSGGGTSFYTLEGVHIDGQGYSITLMNEFGFRHVLNKNGCSYDRPGIFGDGSVCTGAATTYHTDEYPGRTYNWSLSSGGVITSPTDESSVDIQWDNAVSGPAHDNTCGNQQ